jgi:dolichol-phosphate mannosyltransferase
MDADLQHPPALILQLVEEWQKGSKIVKTVRIDTEKTSRFKRMTSSIYYRIFTYFSGVEIRNGMADFRLLDRQVLEDILKFKEEGLFLRGIVEWVGYASSTVAFECGSRFSGESRYTVSKMLRLAWCGVSSFSLVPLRLVVIIGFISSGVAFMGILYAIISKLLVAGTIPGWTSSVVIMSFLFCVLFFVVGILGEYVGKVLVEVRERPRFLISETLGVGEATEVSKPVSDEEGGGS